MVVEVDLARWREEGVSQLSRDAVETMVQVGLQTVSVVDGVETCQNTDRRIPQPSRETLPHWITKDRESQPSPCSTENLCRTFHAA